MTTAERATQIWQVLTSAAHNRQVLTYTIVGELIGMGAGTLAQPLDLIMRYCERNALPPLTVLVVKKDSGIPGEGLTTLQEINADREKVFTYRWFAMLPPTQLDLRSVE